MGRREVNQRLRESLDTKREKKEAELKMRRK